MQDNYLFVKCRKRQQEQQMQENYTIFRKSDNKSDTRGKLWDVLDQQVPFSGQEVQDTTLCWNCQSLAEIGF